MFGRFKGGRPNKAEKNAPSRPGGPLVLGAPEQSQSPATAQIAVDVQVEATAFISYSRKDSAIAEKLVSALRGSGVDAFIDRAEIAPAEDWRARLASLIAAADSVVFVLSPDSAASEVCAWEVSEAERLGKRIVPVLHRETAGIPPPAGLARFNYVFCRSTDEMAAAVEKLSVAIMTDIVWVREHTRLGLAAERWLSLKNANSALLRGEVLSQAEAWLAMTPKSAPPPSELHRHFIAKSREASREEEIERTNTLNQIQLNQSRFLADRARALVQADNPAQALLVSLEGLPDNRSDNEFAHNRPLSSEAFAALCEATDAMLAFTFLGEGAQDVEWGTFSHTGEMFAAAHADGVQVWRLQPTRERILRIETAVPAISMAFSINEQFLAIADAGGAISMHEVETGKLTSDLRVDGCRDIALTLKGEWLIAVKQSGSALLWKPGGGAPFELPWSGEPAASPFSSLVESWRRQAIVRPEAWPQVTLAPAQPSELERPMRRPNSTLRCVPGARKQKFQDQVDEDVTEDGRLVVRSYEHYNGFLIFQRTENGEYRDAGWFELSDRVFRDEAVTTVRFNRAGRRVLAASQEGYATVRDIETGDELVRMASRGGCSFAEFYGDEQFVLTSGDEGFRLFAVGSGREIKLRLGGARLGPLTYPKGDSLTLATNTGERLHFPGVFNRQSWIDRARSLAPTALASTERSKLYLEREQPVWAAQFGKYPHLPGKRVMPWKGSRGEQGDYLRDTITEGVRRDLEAALPAVREAGPAVQRAIIDASTLHFEGMIGPVVKASSWMRNYNIDFDVAGELYGAALKVAERFCDRALVLALVEKYSSLPSPALQEVKARLVQTKKTS